MGMATYVKAITAIIIKLKPFGGDLLYISIVSVLYMYKGA